MAGRQFPEGFRWGTATASYQIEGAVNEDGRGPSIWDTFSHTPGKTLNGDTGDIADDHYHRWPEDVWLMRELGLNAYRFSIAWPRILPYGTGEINQKGLDFYDRLVDGLLANGITPFVTLYHWDLPQALQDRGGWAVRETTEAYANYVDVVVQRLGDRVQYWITHNEPWVVAYIGHFTGQHAPGIRDIATALQVAHHLLLSHGLAVQVIRARQSNAQVGITLNLSPVHPASPSEEDVRAAQLADMGLNRFFLDAVFGKGYPAELVAAYGPFAPRVEADDLRIIAVPIDFLGVNYYAPQFVRSVSYDRHPLGIETLGPEELARRNYQLTEMGWPVVPDGLYELLTRIHRDYAPRAIYITENGAALPDRLERARVDDPQRIAYLHQHLVAAHRAIEEGVPLRGYFVWSLLDNFEWAFGYSKRFGLIYVDYDTLIRVPKASYSWYQRVTQTNTLPDDAEVPGNA